MNNTSDLKVAVQQTEGPMGPKWTSKVIGLAVIGLGLGIGSSGAPMAQTAASDPTIIYRGVSSAERFDISPPLTELAQRQPTVVSTGNPDPDRPTGLEGPYGPRQVDSLIQNDIGSGEIPAPSVGFDAFTNGSFPPDPNGAVGPNHFVVMANSVYAVYTKAGALVVGPANINTLWSGFGGACENENAGDPVVLYDRQTDRWLLTQFTAAGPTFFNCVALSQTNNPAGAYYRWAFSTGTNFPDYPKYGVWSDAYYISTREFSGCGGGGSGSCTTFAGVGAYALNRAQMLVGNPAPQVISFLVPPGGTPYIVGDGLLPSNLDGSTLPPAGRPNFYIGTQDDGGPYGAPSDAINIFKFHVDFAVPGNSTFTGPTVVPVGAFNSILALCGGTRDCIPQLGTAQKIDHLGYRQRPLHRAAYRNFGTYEAIVTNQSVEAVGGISGIRWWEIRSPNSGPTIFQEGTYAPSDMLHRWMGSIAQDRQGNMALGFSVSNAANFPGVRYTGRLVGDPPGTMPQGEGVFVNGTGSQTGGNRWGDYTAMTIDPTDDCTFWYVNEYLQATGGTKTLRVGSFKFPGCALFGPPTFSLAAFGYNAGGWFSNDTYPRVLADVNGDGMADIVGFGYGGAYVSLATGGGNFAPPAFVLGAFGYGAGGWVSNDTYPRVLADVNGDGMADIVGFGYNGVYVSLATGGGNFAPPVFVLGAFGYGAGGWVSNNTYPRVLADVNGDGMADIVGFGYSGVYVSLATGGGNFAPPVFVLGAFGYGAGGWVSNDTYPRVLADVNGDGKADIVGFGSNGVYVSLATGGGNFAPPVFVLGAFGYNAGGWVSNDTYPRVLADVNGDGMADIVGFGSGGVHVSFATGGGNFALPVFALGAFGYNAGGWVSNDTYPRRVADVNGGGKADIVGFGYNGVYVSLSAP
jgi:hypothetical protein